MKTKVWIVLAAAVLAGCGQRVESPASETTPPVISTAIVKHATPYVSGTSQSAPAEPLARRPPRDYKDSVLDTSR